jgi:hypothetical protein
VSGWKPSLPTALTRHKGLKLGSLLLAMVVWLAIEELISFEKTVTNVPVHIRTAPGWIVEDQDPRMADVLFRGTRDDIGYLSRDQISLTVDLTDRAPMGTVTHPLDPSMITAPSGVQALSVQPSTLTATVDQEVTREIPVRVNLDNRLNEGYEVESIAIDPPTVALTGPARVLAAIEATRTEPIPLIGHMGSFQRLARVQPPVDGEFVSGLNPVHVTVTVQIVRRFRRFTLDGVPVRFLMADGKMREANIEPNSVSVVLEGLAARSSEVRPERVVAYIELDSQANGGNAERQVTVAPPPGLNVVSVTPPSVTITRIR